MALALPWSWFISPFSPFTPTKGTGYAHFLVSCSMLWRALTHLASQNNFKKTTHKWNVFQGIIALFLLGEAVLYTGIIVITLLCFHTHKMRSMFVGIICVVFGIIMYGSPLSIVVSPSITCSNFPTEPTFLFSMTRVIIP